MEDAYGNRFKMVQINEFVRDGMLAWNLIGVNRLPLVQEASYALWQNM